MSPVLGQYSFSLSHFINKFLVLSVYRINKKNEFILTYLNLNKIIR